MKTSVADGVALLEVNVAELRMLLAGVHELVSFHASLASIYAGDARRIERSMRTLKRGRVAHQREAGELRAKEAQHAQGERDASDLRRVLHGLTRNLEVK